jgi:ankyrin repeat protein
MLICSFVIERSTLETDWQVNTPDGVRIAWLQKRGVVNDQLFDSYAIFANGLHKSVLTSRRIEASSLPSHQIPDFPKLVVVATVISVVGFIVQFTGLRGMHWSAAVMQLAATIIMACLRAWVRRDLSLRPVALAIPTEHEIDWFSTRLAMDRGWPYNDKEEPRGYDIWSIMSGGDVTGYFTDFSRRDDTSMTDAQTVMRVRERLGDLCDWAGPTSDVAVSVANSVEEVMNTLFADRSGDFVWNLKAVTGSSPLEESIQFTVRKSEKRWVAKAAEIDAALSLWLFTLRKQEDIEQQRQNNGDQKDEGDRLRHGATAVRKPCMRLLCDSTRETHLSLSWWIPDGTAQIVEVEQPKTSQAGSSTDVLEFEKCRIIGSPECTAAHAPSHEPIKFRSRTLDELAQEASDGDIKRAEESDESENPGTPVRRLAIVSDRSLEVVLGQHLFSAFMFAVADHTERPAGDTTVQDASLGSTSGSEQGQTSSKLENSILSRIARRVETFGLGNVQEVYACMIPPLCLKRKLPTALPVVDLVRRLARPHEVVGHWDLAGNMYRRLFKVASMFNPHDIVALRATVLYADFLKQVTAAAEYCDDLCLWEAEKLKTIKTAALDDLKTIDRDIVLPLAWMYRIQGRLKGLEDFMVLRDGENITQHLLPKSLGHTPLHEHAVSGDPCRRIAWLIRMGVPVDAKDILEWTPLHHAAAGGDEKSVTTLLEEGANLNSRDIAEWTPLHYAALNHAGEPAAQQFLHRGAEADTKGRDGIGPLHCAAMRNNERVARLLIESGANVEIQDNFKRTPLHWAAYRGAFPVVQLLLTKGAYLHAREMNGCTALHLAAVQGHKEVVSLLVDKKADLKARSRNGRTALVMAASGGDQVVAGVLVVEGADVHANDTEKRTALHVAAAHGHEEVARVLIVDGKADANAKDIDGWTPLHMASSEGVARVLVVEGKADVNARNEHGETPLHQAAERGNEAVARVLVLDGKANISAVNNFGGTALTMAEVKGHDAIVRLLQP